MKLSHSIWSLTIICIHKLFYPSYELNRIYTLASVGHFSIQLNGL